MSFSFAELKKNANKTTEALTAAIEKTENKKKYENEKDSRFWEPTLDDGGSAFAKIRFLPAPTGEDVPFIKTIRYAFQGPVGADGKARWYMENSLATLGEQDPVQIYNNHLWAKTRTTGDKKYENQAKGQKRNITYISNILVIQDKNNPENDGKVFLFKYGQKIFDKIKAKLIPDFEGEDPIDVFNFWDGADFKIRISMNSFVDGNGKKKEYRDWDKCEFDVQSPLFKGDEEKLQKIWESEYSLQEFLKPENFKSYDELLKKLESVMGVASGELMIEGPVTTKQTNEHHSVSTKSISEELDDDLDHIMNSKTTKINDFTPSNETEDDDDEFFKKLMDDE